MGPSINYVRTYGEGEGSSLLYMSIAYYMQKGGEGVPIACKFAYVLNGRPPWASMNRACPLDSHPTAIVLVLWKPFLISCSKAGRVNYS